MSAGTLVPFLGEVGLPGDTFDIDLDCDIKTHPTIGPLFGSYKVQLDVFQIPIRLYQGLLHMNMPGIGMKMETVKLPQMEVQSVHIDPRKGNIDNQQINPSCLLNYLGIRGIGGFDPGYSLAARDFNALKFLMYWDIYGQYYANKQEEVGMFIHHDNNPITATITSLSYTTPNGTSEIPQDAPIWTGSLEGTQMKFTFAVGTFEEFDPARLLIRVKSTLNAQEKDVPLSDMYTDFIWDSVAGTLIATFGQNQWMENYAWYLMNYSLDNSYRPGEVIPPKIASFPIEEISNMRVEILRATGEGQPAFKITKDSRAPYGKILDYEVNDTDHWNSYVAVRQNQEGLALKTYMSDLFNNWISTEWIEGDNGINAITAINTESGSFTLDTLNMANKVYNMLNRIAISGGTYDDYLDAVWDHDRFRGAETPVYMGGLIKELVFQEVVSNASAAEGTQPLGTLAGRGVLGKKHKGGKVRVKISEPSYVMGIISLTPRIDYSQGNKWDSNLRTMNDFHKPALDQIGFQDLITDQMAFWDTYSSWLTQQTYRSAGKQPAWLNYMTNVNEVKGNFADESQQMFMVLTRRYEAIQNGDQLSIKDLTTYIDPAKFNYIFADTRRDAQNFWAQIAVDMIVRRKMSAKQIPNL